MEFLLLIARNVQRANPNVFTSVLEFSESPLDTNAIRKLFAAGNAHILAKLRLPLPGVMVRPTIH
jgi:hypothetical protein